MTRPTGYSIAGYGDMITDGPRMAAYTAALQAAVRPGCTVLDLGAGTGVFALLACRFGAGHVHAVEPDDAILLARDLAAANGVADRITFHQALSTQVELAARADVIISDLRGVLPLFQHHIASIVDARRRLLAPRGVLIPRRDTLWVALVEDATLYRHYAEPWTANEFGLDMRAGHAPVVNSWRKTNAKAEQLLVPPQCWAELDYATVTTPDVMGEVAWSVARGGIVHGLLLWFDAELAPGIGFSNAPGGPELIYGQAFFPLQAPVQLLPGDRVEVRLRADLTGDDYTWQWRTRVTAADGTTKANYHQSTFFAAPLSPATLRRQEAGFVPTLSDDGLVDRFLLDRMDGATPLAEIARAAAAAFPARFPAWTDALTRAGELAVKYSR